MGSFLAHRPTMKARMLMVAEQARATRMMERGVSRSLGGDTARLLADALGLSGTTEPGSRLPRAGALPRAGMWLPGRYLGIAAATRTLLRDIALLMGREPEIESVMTAVTGAGGVVDICAIEGMAGVGKTALADGRRRLRMSRRCSMVHL